MIGCSHILVGNKTCIFPADINKLPRANCQVYTMSILKIFTLFSGLRPEQGEEPDLETISGLPEVLQFLYNKNKAADEPGEEGKLINPVYKSIHTYKWIPVFGINIYAWFTHYQLMLSGFSKSFQLHCKAP
jgi:hypothetical protein